MSDGGMEPCYWLDEIRRVQWVAKSEEEQSLLPMEALNHDFLVRMHPFFAECMHNNPPEELLGELSKKCRMATLNELLRWLLERAEDTRLDADIRELADKEITRLGKLQRLWHLCEIFHLTSNKSLSLELCMWINQNYHNSIEPLDTLGQADLHVPEENLVLRTRSHPAREHKFWPAVFRLALQGRLAEVWALLRLHTDVDQAVAQGGAALASCRMLQQLLLSHPYAASLSGASTSHIPSSVNLYAKLLEWKARVDAFRAAPEHGELLGVVPQITRLLRLLSPSADGETLVDHCDGDWEVLVVAQLLYLYPPPLSREALWTITEAAIKRLPRPEVARDFIDDMHKVMVGYNASNFLKRMSQLSKDEDMSKELGASPLPGLACTALVCALLGCTRAESHALDAMQQDDAGNNLRVTSYEKLLIDVLCQICNHGMDLVVVVEYVKFLPRLEMRRDLIQALLPGRAVGSDDECQAVAEVLGDYGLEEERRKVLLQRGQWWSARGAEGMDTEGGDGAGADGDGGGEAVDEGEGAARTLLFYLRADNQPGVVALLDDCLFQLSRSVCLCREALFGGDCPMTPVTRHAPLRRFSPPLALPPPAGRSSLRALKSLLGQATQMVSLLDEHLQSIAPVQVPGLERLGVGLDAYCQCIEICLRQAQEGRRDEAELALAASWAMNCAVKPEMAIPVRYWLHAIELCLALCGLFRGCPEVSAHRAGRPTAIGKDDVYALVARLEGLALSVDAPRLLYRDQGPVGARSGAGEGVEAARAGLMQLLTEAVCFENRLQGERRREADRAAVTREPAGLIALDMLTGATIRRQTAGFQNL